MTKTWKERTGSITVRRKDDDAEFQLDEISTFHERSDMHGVHRSQDRLKDVVGPDGRGVFTPDEINFFFEDEPDRAMLQVS